MPRGTWPKQKRLPGHLEHLVLEETVALFRHWIFFPPLSRTDEEIKTRVRSGRSEEAVVAGYVGEAAEGVGAAGGQTGAQLRSPAHRVGHHLSGELRIDVLEVSRASLGE